MAITPQLIQSVRFEVQDTEPGLYILDDAVITYCLEKNQESVARASLDAARMILMRLSMDASEDTVDIFTFKGAKAADAYRLALELYIKSPSLNPLLKTAGGYFGGVSKSDMLSNDFNSDNNTVQVPSQEKTKYSLDHFNYF